MVKHSFKNIFNMKLKITLKPNNKLLCFDLHYIIFINFYDNFNNEKINVNIEMMIKVINITYFKK
jgi:hypothetical protein